MKKSVKKVITVISVILALIIAVAAVLYLTSSRHRIFSEEIKRAYIYHNELDRELYVLNEEELSKLRAVFESRDASAFPNFDYEPVDGGPWFSIFCELEGGRTLQVYSAGDEYMLIDSVPFKVDSDTANALFAVHTEIEEKILPLSSELLEEIMNKREQ